MKKIASSLLLFFISSLVFSQVSADYTVRVSATYTESPATITLQWPVKATAIEYLIYKKAKEESNWGSAIATLDAAATSFTDNDVIIDSLYEYKIYCSNTGGINSFGYILAGIKVHATHYRGSCLLVVDTTITSSMENELYRLMQDISGDGWKVKRINVARDQTPDHVRTLITAEAIADPELQCVFLFGRVPVLYSGNFNPDGHPDHQGAWPADAIYGDIDGAYTDITINNVIATRPENWNIPGDGKLDQISLISKVELQIGRVDLSNLPSFPQTEEVLLKNYLNSDHNFRNGNIAVQERALIDDNFGAFGGEAFASSGWRNFAPMFGADNTFEMDYFTTMYSENYLWSYGCGGGWFQGAGGVGSTVDFAFDTVNTIFTMLFGSYFGDWDATDDFLRAPLASGITLTNCWAGRPHWQFHQMVLGENIGYSTRTTQNNTSLYVANIFPHTVHIALMGDPSLRMHTIKPVGDVNSSIATGIVNAIEIDYTNSPDPVVLGYYIYRSDSEFGKYTLITGEMINYSPFIDEYPINGTNYYMVRAASLKETPSGSYYNLSPGITDSISIEFTDIDNTLNTSFAIHPNPASEFIVVNCPANLVGEEIIIKDITGKLVYNGICSSVDTHINVAEFNPGIYLISIKDLTRKLVIL